MVAVYHKQCYTWTCNNTAICSSNVMSPAQDAAAASSVGRTQPLLQPGLNVCVERLQLGAVPARAVFLLKTTECHGVTNALCRQTF